VKPTPVPDTNLPDDPLANLVPLAVKEAAEKYRVKTRGQTGGEKVQSPEAIDQRERTLLPLGLSHSHNTLPHRTARMSLCGLRSRG